MPNNDKPAIMSREEIELISVYVPDNDDFNDICKLRESHLVALDEIQALHTQLDSITETHKIVMAEVCADSPETDMRHCTCVPVLRGEIQRLRATMRTCDAYSQSEMAAEVHRLQSRQLPEGLNHADHPPKATAKKSSDREIWLLVNASVPFSAIGYHTIDGKWFYLQKRSRCDGITEVKRDDIIGWKEIGSC